MPLQSMPKLLTLLAATALVPSGLASCSANETRQPARAETGLEQPDYVVDQAGVLSPVERQKLTAQLAGFQHATLHQLVVVTVADLGGEEIAAFTRKLGIRWGIGRKGINDGIIILVAPHDRKARIAVGYGLERQLPDAFCYEVMDRKMIPAFADRRFSAGIEAGVSAIIARLTAKDSEAR